MSSIYALDTCTGSAPLIPRREFSLPIRRHDNDRRLAPQGFEELYLRTSPLSFLLIRGQILRRERLPFVFLSLKGLTQL